MTENIITEVLHRLVDLEPEICKRVQTALHIVLCKYDISPKCTEIRVLNDSWVDDLERFKSSMSKPLRSHLSGFSISK